MVSPPGGGGVLACRGMEPSPPPGPSTLRTIRLLILSAAVAQVALFVALLVGGVGFTQADTVWVALPLILGAADLVLVPAVGSTVRPLPHGVGATDAQRISGGVMVTVTWFRFVLAEAPMLFGLVASLVAGSLLPYTIGSVFSAPLLLLFVLPTQRVVDAIRQRLESGGTPSHLWESLRG
jgi:hypothetical protein